MAIVAASFTLAGCGGGGDTPDAAPSTSVDTGRASDGATAAVAHSVCDEGVYGADFTLSTVQSIDPVATLAKPAKGVRLTEPTYKTCLVRRRDHMADGVPGSPATTTRAARPSTPTTLASSSSTRSTAPGTCTTRTPVRT